ncbi:MAG: ChaN family lipoprotein, partial [Planctomycetota bacterium]
MQSRRRRELGCGLICLIALLFTSCQSPETGATRSRAARRSPAQPPHLDSVVRVFEGKGARETTLWKMLDRLAEAEVVFLGETHVDETTHRVEAAVLEGLIARRDGRVVLAMEMFERDVQPIIDRYLAGEIDEAEFLKSSRPWRNYRTGYRPLIEAAKRQGLPVVAANIPASLRRKIGRGGKEAFEGLTDEERGWAPAELHLSGDPYWKRFERVVRGHLSGMFGGDLEKLVYSGQSLWDNTMGESCALALERHPGRLLLHVNGGFHTGYRQGTVEQLLARRPGTRVRTITVVPVKDLAGIDPEPEDERADYVIYAAERARGVSEGT